MKKTSDISKAIYDPPLRSRLALQAAEEMERKKDRAIRLGMGEELGRYYLPMRAGSLNTIIALSGHGKSAVMHHVANQAAKQITAQGRHDECIVIVTWEQTVEEFGLMDIGRDTGYSIADFAQGLVKDWEPVKRAAVALSTVPVYTIGYSLEARRQIPRLTMTQVAGALMWMEDHAGVKPALVVLDYLQAMDVAGMERDDRRLEVRENVYRAKTLSFDMGCPVLMGCQAKQVVATRRYKLPGMYDAEESSSVAQRSDSVLSLWMPKKTELPGEPVIMGEKTYEVTENLLFLKVCKQRFGPDGRVFSFFLDGGRNRIYPLEEKRAT